MVRSELMIGRTVYGESLARSGSEEPARQGRSTLRSGRVVTSDDHDFKGNLLSSRRQLARDYKTTLGLGDQP